MTEARSLEDCRLCKKQIKVSLDRTSKIREQKRAKRCKAGEKIKRKNYVAEKK